MLRPGDIAGDQTAQHAREFLRLFFPGDQEAPWLRVVARGGPARRFQDAEQLFRFDRLGRENGRAPACADDIQYAVFHVLFGCAPSAAGCGYGSVTTPTANPFKVTETEAAAEAGGPPAVA